MPGQSPYRAPNRHVHSATRTLSLSVPGPSNVQETLFYPESGTQSSRSRRMSTTSSTMPRSPSAAHFLSSPTRTSSRIHSSSSYQPRQPRARTASHVAPDLHSISAPYAYEPPSYHPPQFTQYSDIPFEELPVQSRQFLNSFHFNPPPRDSRYHRVHYLNARFRELQLELDAWVEQVLDSSTIGLVGLAVESRADEIGATPREADLNQRAHRRSSSIQLAQSPFLSAHQRHAYENYAVFEEEGELESERDWEEEKWKKEQKRLELANEFFRERFAALDEYMRRADSLVWLDLSTRPKNFRRDPYTGIVPVDREAERALRTRFCETTLKKMDGLVRKEMKLALEQWG